MPQASNGPNPKQRLEAALKQAEAGDFSGLDGIVASLTSTDSEVRFEAAYCCIRIGFPAAIDPLKHMALHDPVSDNRNHAIYALASIGRPAVVPTLIAALGDDDGARRDDARTALYRVLGREVLRLLADEEMGSAPDDQEVARVAAWWQAARFDPTRVYAFGEPASPGVFIRELKASRTSLPDALLNTLRDWTGEDFGQVPLSRVVAKWEKWRARNRGNYEPGLRYFYGRPVPR